MRLTKQQSRFYETFGFLKFPGLFKDDVGYITDAYEKVFEAEFRESDREHNYKEKSTIIPFADRSEYLSGLLDDPRIDAVVTSILGTTMGTGPATVTITSETRSGTPTICPTIRTTHLRSPSTSIRYAAIPDASGSSREAAIGGTGSQLR